MKLLGLDPGTAITGFSILEKNGSRLNLLDYGCIRTSKDLSAADRLQQIAEDLTTIIQKWQPQEASIEKIFFQKNVKTAISVAQARGVLVQKLTEAKIAISEFTPSQIKSSVCGHGRADKKMIQQMIKLTFKLANPPQPDDAADAIAAALCLANYAKYQPK